MSAAEDPTQPEVSDEPKEVVSGEANENEGDVRADLDADGDQVFVPTCESTYPLPENLVPFTTQIYAIDWIRYGNGSGAHRYGCICQQCDAMRPIARDAIGIHNPGCTKNNCKICWAREAWLAGKL